MKKRESKTVLAVAKRLMPGLSRRPRKIREQIREGYSPVLGFLHIPKTGGSGIAELGRRAVAAGQPFPCIFGHDWPFEAIRKDYPRMRIALIVRDPLERAISGFNSRLRQGRPTYKIPWRPEEAAAFALFPDVTRWLDALIADDEWSLSARTYAEQHVTHLRWNYRYYFRSPAAVRRHAASIALVGRIEETQGFIDALVAEAGLRPETVAGLYERLHEAAVRPSKLLAGYGEGEVARMRARFDADYAIYDALVGLAPARPAAGSGAA